MQPGILTDAPARLGWHAVPPLSAPSAGEGAPGHAGGKVAGWGVTSMVD